MSLLTREDLFRAMYDADAVIQEHGGDDPSAQLAAVGVAEDALLDVIADLFMGLDPERVASGEPYIYLFSNGFTRGLVTGLRARHVGQQPGTLMRHALRLIDEARAYDGPGALLAWEEIQAQRVHSDLRACVQHYDHREGEA